MSYYPNPYNITFPIIEHHRITAGINLYTSINPLLYNDSPYSVNMQLENIINSYNKKMNPSITYNPYMVCSFGSIPNQFIKRTNYD
jgi:hypothetical protein